MHRVLRFVWAGALLFPASLHAATQDCVVLLHGIARSATSLNSVERYLEQQGYTTANLDYPGQDDTLEAIVASLKPNIDQFAKACTGSIHFVTHSMGGLVARGYLNQNRPANLGRVVMMGPPNQGSELADALKDTALYQSFFGPAGQELTTERSEHLRRFLGTPDYPLGVIAGTSSVNLPASAWVLPGDDDGAVTVSRTHVEGETAFTTLPVNHTFMMNSEDVQKKILSFLQTERF